MEWDFVLLTAIVAIGFFAGFVHSAIGFGFGIVAITLLPLVIGTRQTHVVVSLASVPVMISAVWAYRHGADRRALARALVGAALGMPLGLWLFQSVESRWLIKGTGLAILVMIAVSFYNRKLAKTGGSGRGSPGVAGAIGGFFAGAVSIAGPPVAAYALQQDWEQAKFKAFLNEFLLVVSFFRTAGLFVVDAVETSACFQALWLFPMAMVGIHVGAKFSQRLSSGWFQIIVVVALVAVATWFVVRD